MAKAVRQRYDLATGGSGNVPAPPSQPRKGAYRGGGAVDKTTFQKYGNGFRRMGAGKGR